MKQSHLLAALQELDKEYDFQYLRACDGGSTIGAAQIVGKRMAIVDFRKIVLEEESREQNREVR